MKYDINKNDHSMTLVMVCISLIGRDPAVLRLQPPGFPCVFFLQPRRRGLAPFSVSPLPSFPDRSPRHIQRRLSQAPLILRLDVGVALLDQKLDDFQTAVYGCQAQQHPLILVLRLDVGACLLDQKLDDFQMAVHGHAAQWRLSPFILRLDVGATLLDQKLDDVQMTILGREAQWRQSP